MFKTRYDENFRDLNSKEVILPNKSGFDFKLMESIEKSPSKWSWAVSENAWDGDPKSLKGPVIEWQKKYGWKWPFDSKEKCIINIELYKMHYVTSSRRFYIIEKTETDYGEFKYNYFYIG